MRKKILFSAILLFTLFTGHTQRVYYAPIEKSIPGSTEFIYQIIGKVKENILVWKYSKSTHLTNVLVYDDKMKLNYEVPVDLAINVPILQFDFINRGNSIDVIFQYYVQNEFLCKTIRLDHEGKPLRSLQTISEVKNTIPNGSEVMNCIVSENKTNTAMIRVLSGLKKDTVLFDYILLDKDLVQNGANQAFIPIINGRSQVSPYTLNNNGDLIFVESMSTANEEGTSEITVYKIKKDGDSVLTCSNKINWNLLTDINFKIDYAHDQYLVSGVYRNVKKLPGGQVKVTSDGIFTWLLNPDLTERVAEKFYTFTPFAGSGDKENQFDNFSISEISLQKDSGIYISCISKVSHVNTVGTQTPSYYSEQPFAKPYVYPIYTVDVRPTDGVPNKPMYLPSSSPVNQSLTSRPPSYGAPTVNTSIKNIKLLVFDIDNKSELRAKTLLKNDDEKEFFSRLDLSQSIITGNTLHIVYPKTYGKKKQLLGEAVIKSKGASSLNPIMAVDLNYNFETQHGIQVDDHSIVYPCLVKNHNSFAKVEF